METGNGQRVRSPRLGGVGEHFFEFSVGDGDLKNGGLTVEFGTRSKLGKNDDMGV